MAALETDWDRLAARARSPLLDHHWFTTAARALYAEGDLRVVVVREQGAVVAIAPLALSSRFPGRVSIIGADHVFEPGGWLAASEPAVARLARAVVDQGLVAELRRMPAQVAERLPTHVRPSGLGVVRPAMPTLGIETAGGLDALMAGLPASARTAHKKMRARWRRAGDSLVVTRVRPDRAAMGGLMDQFIRVEASGWKGRDGSALARHDRTRRFYEEYMAGAAARGRAVIAVLHVAGEIAAMELDVEAHRRLWSLKMGFDERFATVSPGLLLADANVRAVFEDGLDGYELLGAAEEWQRRWAPVEREYRAVTLYPFSARGVAALGTDGAKYVARRLAARRSA